MVIGLFFIGIIAGFVDAIAGGGGLITLPALLSFGLPPQVALATNKLQSSFGSFMAAYSFFRKDQIRLGACWPGIVCTFFGAAMGTYAVTQLNTDFLAKIIPWLLGLILVYVIFSPKMGDVDSQARMKNNSFYLVFGLLFGFYDGFLGPGTGSFWVVAFVALLGFNLVKATAYTKVMNFVSNIVSLSVFLFYGHSLLSVGLVMGCGQLIGAKIGAGMVLKKGRRLIKPLFMLMVSLTIAQLICRNM